MSAVRDRVWTDPELADLLRDDPRLVAIADALRESGGIAVQRRRRRRALPGAVIAAALCLAVVVALVAPWSNSGNGSLADRALAAIGTQPVLHVVVDLAPRGQLIDLKTGAAAPLREQREIWYDGDRGLEHNVYRSAGVVVWDQLETPKGEVSTAGSHLSPRANPPYIEPALQGFVDGYREALASGAAKQTGKGSFDGVPVVWLSFALQGGDSEEVALAEDSGRPLFVKMCSGPCWTYQVKTIETMSVDSADFSRPVESEAVKHEFSGLKNDRNLTVVPVSSVPEAVPGAVWAGSSVKGLPFASATRENYRTTFGDGAAKDWSGAQLVYGAISSEDVPDWEQPFVQLWESTWPESAYLMTPRVPPLPTSELDGRLYVPWTGAQSPSPSAPLAMNALTGYTVVNGVHVTVRASSGELLVAAARALRPID
jgi:hypothetical protein